MAHVVRIALTSLLVLSCLAARALAEPGAGGLAARPFASEPDLGATRGLCIGSEVECLVGGAATGGFDLLVSFANDSADLTDESKANLARFAVALKSNRLSTASFLVEGHSDAYGEASYNLALSERRAQSVRDYLLEQGVPPEKLTAAGVGETEPRTDDPYDPANRRVIMKIQMR